MRRVIFHLHLFKNAGTSIDALLRRNFGARWVARDFGGSMRPNAQAVAQWIIDTPDAQAFSTHTMQGPLPQIEGIEIRTVMALRDPVARIKSAYLFERDQQAETWGARLAKTESFEGYVAQRLQRPNDRQCRNFQTQRLASMRRGPAAELPRAVAALEEITVLGLVDRFDDLADRLGAACADMVSDGDWRPIRRNAQKQGAAQQISSPEFDVLLGEVNADDRAVLEAARKMLGD